MLLIVDEAQTALGRCGDLFAIEHPSNNRVVPDILTMSKTLGNGLPLSAVIASNAVAQAAQERGFVYVIQAYERYTQNRYLLQPFIQVLYYARERSAPRGSGIESAINSSAQQ